MFAVQSELWAIPSPRTCELIRAVAEQLSPLVGELDDPLYAATIDVPEYRQVAEDPVLADATRRANIAHIKLWLTSNIHHPGRRVELTFTTETSTYARDVALRGLTTNDLDAWRGAHRVYWSWWLEGCFAATTNPAELHELIEVSATSITTFIDDSIAALAASVDEVRSELADGPQLQRYATVELILQGNRIERAQAESQLGYVLAGDHLAAIVWVASEDDADKLDLAAEQVMRACDAPRRLTLVASTAALWLWMPVHQAPSAADLQARLHDLPGVRVALGRGGNDIVGFRRSHLDAAAAQRLLARLQSKLVVVRYDDVHLVDLLTNDVAQADQFVIDTLGDLASAEPILRKTIRTFVDEGFNRSSTAERLSSHRNTVDRRLTRADELLPRPLAQNTTNIVAALTLLELREQ